VIALAKAAFLVMVRGSFFVFRDVLQRSEYAGFDQGNLICNQGGGGVHSAHSILDVVQAADGCGEQAAGLFPVLVHGTSSVFGIALRAHGYAAAYATIIAIGTPTYDILLYTKDLFVAANDGKSPSH
jgi:hypothetical protein